jgi:hypothetical protein
MNNLVCYVGNWYKVYNTMHGQKNIKLYENEQGKKQRNHDLPGTDGG